MESRAELRGEVSSIWLGALLVVIVTLVLGLIAIYVSRTVSAPATTPTHNISTEAGPAGISHDEQGNLFANCAPDFTPC